LKEEKMDKVPREVLLYIFSFLPVKDVSAVAGLVCKEWSIVASDEFGWKERTQRYVRFNQ